MRINLKHPFNQYKAAYLNFHIKMGRWQVCLVGESKRKTILYSKFLMSIKIGRELQREEEVDHVNGDKTDDSIDNLEVVTNKENRKRYDATKSRNMVTLICPYCRSKFTRERRQTHLIRGGRKTTCSRRCGGKMSHYS